MTISIIIPNYNGADLLKKNLPAVYKAANHYKKVSGNDFEIIVVDDASKDTSKEVVASLPLPVQFLAHEKNVGFASNVNRGVKKANGEILILLNTDVSPTEDFLVPLLTHFSDERVFAVGCMDRTEVNGRDEERGRGVGKWEKGFLMHRKGDIQKSNTLWASGGSSAFRKSVWDTLGGLYDIYNPFYWEDIDVSYRALKAGYSVLFEPKSIVNHEHDKGAIKTQFSKRSVTVTAYRNQFLFVWVNITDTGLIFSHVLRLPLHMLQALFRGDGAFFSGFGKAVRLLPQALKLRKRNRKHFVKSDTDILQKFIN